MPATRSILIFEDDGVFREMLAQELVNNHGLATHALGNAQ
jgi:hypothetical protein